MQERPNRQAHFLRGPQAPLRLVGIQIDKGQAQPPQVDKAAVRFEELRLADIGVVVPVKRGEDLREKVQAIGPLARVRHCRTDEYREEPRTARIMKQARFIERGIVEKL